MTRKAKINRKTKETNIIVEVNLDGKGSYEINTKIGFIIIVSRVSKYIIQFIIWDNFISNNKAII